MSRLFYVHFLSRETEGIIFVQDRTSGVFPGQSHRFGDACFVRGGLIVLCVRKIYPRDFIRPGTGMARWLWLSTVLTRAEKGTWTRMEISGYLPALVSLTEGLTLTSSWREVGWDISMCILTNDR